MIQYYPQEQQMKHKAAGVDYPGRFFVIFITVIQCSVGFSLQANDPLQNQVQGIGNSSSSGRPGPEEEREMGSRD